MKKLLSLISMLAIGMSLATFTSCEPNGPEGPEFEASHTFQTAMDAVYSTENGKGVYSVTLVTSTLDNQGYPANVGDMMFKLNLYAGLDEDPMNAVIPDGTYTADTLANEMTWNPLATGIYVRIAEGTSFDALGIEFMTEGTVYSKLNGDDYTLQIAFKTSSGTEIKAEYVGPIYFQQGGSSGNSFELFAENQNVTFTEASGTYYGSWAYPHADDATLHFKKNILDEDGNVMQTYSLTAMLFTPKFEDYNVANPQMPSGTYDVTMKKTPDMNNTPFTVSYGFLAEYMGSYIPFGSSLIMTDYKTGKTYVGYFTDGSMTIDNNGGEYDINFNFTTPEGLTMGGSYKGAIAIENKNNNDSDPNYLGANGKPISTLTESIELDIPEDDIALIAHYGNYIFPNLSAWYLNLGMADEKGDFIQSEILKSVVPYKDAYSSLPGTYKVNYSYEANTLLPGYSSFGNNSPFYTWYGDLDSYDANEGYHTRMAPIEEGTMTIEDIGNGLQHLETEDIYVGTYKFTFDFTDDAGNKITGSWSGTVTILDNDLTVPVEGGEEDGGHQHSTNIVKPMYLR